MKKIITRRVAAVAGVAAAAAVGMTSLAAGGALAGPVPGGKVTKTLADGTPVTVALYDQNVNIQRAVTNVQTSREIWASGKVSVTVGGKAEGGSIKAGYLVGCQVNFGASAGVDTGISTGDTSGFPDADTANNTPGGTATSDAGVTLGPGAVKTLWLINTTSGSDTAYDSYNVNDYSFKGNSGGVQYSQEQFGVDGCAGYASAQPIVQVTVSTKSVKGVVTLRGAAFSLG